MARRGLRGQLTCIALLFLAPGEDPPDDDCQGGGSAAARDRRRRDIGRDTRRRHVDPSSRRRAPRCRRRGDVLPQRRSVELRAVQQAPPEPRQQPRAAPAARSAGRPAATPPPASDPPARDASARPGAPAVTALPSTLHRRDPLTAPGGRTSACAGRAGAVGTPLIGYGDSNVHPIWMRRLRFAGCGGGRAGQRLLGDAACGRPSSKPTRCRRAG